MLTIEMVGPAGSTSEGAFSCATTCEEDEFCALLEPLLDDCARAASGGRPANRKSAAAERRTEDRIALNVIENPALKSTAEAPRMHHGAPLRLDARAR